MKKLLVMILASFTLSAMGAPNAKKIANGKFLFEDWGCKACHGIGTLYNQDPLEGPNLEGLYSRRSAEWVKKFTKSPKDMIESGDKDAVELSQKYPKLMKTLKISDAEWDDILEYLKSATKK